MVFTTAKRPGFDRLPSCGNKLGLFPFFHMRPSIPPTPQKEKNDFLNHAPPPPPFSFDRLLLKLLFTVFNTFLMSVILEPLLSARISLCVCVCVCVCASLRMWINGSTCTPSRFHGGFVYACACVSEWLWHSVKHMRVFLSVLSFIVSLFTRRPYPKRSVNTHIGSDVTVSVCVKCLPHENLQSRRLAPGHRARRPAVASRAG